MKNKICKGRIVVVMEGLAFGNAPGTVTKVLDKPNRLSDTNTLLTGRKYATTEFMSPIVPCEPISRRGTHHINNAPIVYEKLHDLRLPTEEEKELYKQQKKSK